MDILFEKIKPAVTSHKIINSLKELREYFDLYFSFVEILMKEENDIIKIKIEHKKENWNYSENFEINVKFEAFPYNKAYSQIWERIIYLVESGFIRIKKEKREELGIRINVMKVKEFYDKFFNKYQGFSDTRFVVFLKYELDYKLNKDK